MNLMYKCNIQINKEKRYFSKTKLYKYFINY
jgi:hypothetical protein